MTTGCYSRQCPACAGQGRIEQQSWGPPQFVHCQRCSGTGRIDAERKLNSKWSEYLRFGILLPVILIKTVRRAQKRSKSASATEGTTSGSGSAANTTPPPRPPSPPHRVASVIPDSGERRADKGPPTPPKKAATESGEPKQEVITCWCPTCGRRFRTRSKHAGHMATCKRCTRRFEFPMDRRSRVPHQPNLNLRTTANSLRPPSR